GTALSGGQLAPSAAGPGKKVFVNKDEHVVYTYTPRTDNKGALEISGDAVGSGSKITIENFDLSAAKDQGYLGIKLDTTQKVAIGDVGANPFNTTSSPPTATKTLAERAAIMLEAAANAALPVGAKWVLDLLGGLSGIRSKLGITKGDE